MTNPIKKNIIIFGESGCGKSSIVNMIVGRDTAKVSDGGLGCTFEHECHEASIGDTRFNIYDTAGLNEGEQGRVPHWQAIHQLYTLIRTLDGVSLLIYCMRGRIKENARANWILFSEVLCAKKVPVIAVETGLENVEDLEGRHTLLKGWLKGYGIVPRDIACVVSYRGRKHDHDERYNWSQHQLRRLIMRFCLKTPWRTDDWIGQIYKTTYSTNLCLFSDVKVEFAREAGNVVDDFIEKAGMKKDESEKLKSTLLDAEKKFTKKRKYMRL